MSEFKKKGVCRCEGKESTRTSKFLPARAEKASRGGGKSSSLDDFKHNHGGNKEGGGGGGLSE